MRSLHALPSGACLIDTPGLRTLRLDADAGEVVEAFDDIARLAPQCRFRDCRHDGEPGCAVRGALFLVLASCLLPSSIFNLLLLALLV